MEVNPVAVGKLLNDLIKKEFPSSNESVPNNCEKLVAEELLNRLKEYICDFELDEEPELFQGWFLLLETINFNISNESYCCSVYKKLILIIDFFRNSTSF